jgi:hypothetical protein
MLLKDHSLDAEISIDMVMWGPPHNVRPFVLFLQQHPKTDPMGLSKDNLNWINISNIVKKPYHFYLTKLPNIYKANSPTRMCTKASY